MPNMGRMLTSGQAASSWPRSTAKRRISSEMRGILGRSRAGD